MISDCSDLLVRWQYPDMYNDALNNATGGGVNVSGQHTGTTTSDPAWASALSFMTSYQGGEQFVQTLGEDFWQEGLRPAMQNMTRQIHTATIDQSRQYGSYYDASQQASALMKKQQQEYQESADSQISENACAATTVTSGIGDSISVKKAVTQALSKQKFNRTNSKVGSVAAEGPIADMKLRESKYALFCDPSLNAGSAGCTVEGELSNADLRWGNTVLNKLTLPYDDVTPLATPITALNGEAITTHGQAYRVAVEELLTNLVEPIVQNPVSVNKANTLNGKTELALRRSEEARRQVAHHALSRMLAARTPSGAAGDGISTWINDIRQEAGVPTAALSDNPSYYEVMHVLTKERFWDPEYFTQLGTEDLNVIEQEQAMIDSFITMQHKDNADMMEQINILLATLSASKSSGDTTGSGAASSDSCRQTRRGKRC